MTDEGQTVDATTETEANAEAAAEGTRYRNTTDGTERTSTETLGYPWVPVESDDVVLEIDPEPVDTGTGATGEAGQAEPVETTAETPATG